MTLIAAGKPDVHWTRLTVASALPWPPEPRPHYLRGVCAYLFAPDVEMCPQCHVCMEAADHLMPASLPLAGDPKGL